MREAPPPLYSMRKSDLAEELAEEHAVKSITGDDKLNIGKHCDKTYRWVLKHDRGYSQWAVLMLSQNMCSPMLARFARWAKAHGVHALPTHKLKMTLADAMSADIVIDESAIWTNMDGGFEVIGGVTDDDVYISE